MWVKNYDILRMYSSTPAYKLPATDFTSKPDVRFVNGNHRYLDNATSATTAQWADLLNLTWSTNYNSALTTGQITVDIGTSDIAGGYGDGNLYSPLDATQFYKTDIIPAAPALDYENGKVIQRVVVNYKNNTANSVTINEWGLFAYPFGLGALMLKREVLETGIIIQGNDSVALNFEYTLPLSDLIGNYYGTITDTWEEIVANCNAGTVDKYQVGDTKILPFMINGTETAVMVEVFKKNEETISGTTNKAALTWKFRWLPLSHNMNDSSTNAGGWMGVNGDYYDVSQDRTDGVLTYGCGMRKWGDQQKANLPEIVLNNLKLVDFVYDTSEGNQTCQDYISIPSSTDLNTVYTDNNRRICGYNTGAMNYWTSTRNASVSSGFYSVDNSGGIDNSNANRVYGAPLCFRL